MKTFKFFIIGIATSFFLNSCGSQASPIIKTDEIALAPGITNSAKELTRITDNDIAEMQAKLSPDGTKIIYLGIDRTKKSTESYSIYMKEIGKPSTTPLTSGFAHSPEWASNSKEYFYTYLKPQKQLIVKSKIDGMGINFVSPNALGESDSYANMSLNPKIKKIIFHTKIGNNLSICTIDPNGMNFTMLVDGFNPTWHPKDNKFIYSKKVGDHTHIFTYDLDTNQISQMSSGSSQYIYPRYSPDGGKIVYASSADGSGQYHIFYMNADGTMPVQLTTGMASNVEPFWGNDGNIYFTSNAGTKKLNTESIWEETDIWRVKPIIE